MFRRLFACVALVLVLWLPASAANFNSPLSTLDLKPGDTIVFLGDSITHQCLYTQYVEDYLYTRFPKVRVKVYNAGAAGARVRDTLRRFDEDVAAQKPKYVAVLLGMNDGGFRAFDEATFQTYRKDMRALVDKIASSGAKPILMTPTMHDSRALRLVDEANPNRPKTAADRLEFYNSVLAYYGAWLRELAVESGHGFVDVYSPLNNITLAQRKADPNFTLMKDGSRPDAPGHLIMAAAIIESLGLPQEFSAIRLERGAEGKPVTEVTGGQIVDLTMTDESTEFTWQADSLPWVFPDEAQLGAKLSGLDERFNRERLEIHGLPPGKYELSIDDALIGTFTSQELARQIDLQGNAKTPQHAQALKVAELNKQRNREAVLPLRSEWYTFQRHAQLDEFIKNQPQDARFKKEFDLLTKQLAGRDERIRKASAKAQEIEDQIFATNVIPPRKYVLKLVGGESPSPSDTPKEPAETARTSDKPKEPAETAGNSDKPKEPTETADTPDTGDAPVTPKVEVDSSGVSFAEQLGAVARLYVDGTARLILKRALPAPPAPPAVDKPAEDKQPAEGDSPKPEEKPEPEKPAAEEKPKGEPDPKADDTPKPEEKPSDDKPAPTPEEKPEPEEKPKANEQPEPKP